MVVKDEAEPNFDTEAEDGTLSGLGLPLSGCSDKTIRFLSAAKNL